MASQRVIVCRTHFVDDRLVEFARSLHGRSSYNIVFAVDETQGSVDTFEFDKIVLTREAFDVLNIFNQVDDIFWRCGDYCLYLARKRYPDCEKFWLIEYDVTINRADPLSFFVEIDEAHDHDFLSAHFRKAEDSWTWGHPMRDYSNNVYRAYFPLVRLTARALDFAMAERARVTEGFRQILRERHLEWPNDESFIATTLHNNGFRCSDYNELGKYYSDNTFWMSVLIHPTKLPPYDNMIYHAVRTGKQYLKIVFREWCINPLPEPIDLLRLAGVDWTLDEIEYPLKESIMVKLEGIGDNPERIMAHDSVISQVLAQSCEAPVLRAVVQALGEARMLSCLQVLRTWQIARWMPHIPALDNVALAKPAWQSSFSSWSKKQSARLDAEGCNNGQINVDFGFHTNIEPRPWWTVDLMNIYLISRVCIYNRRMHSERLNGFRILASDDGYAWRMIYESPLTTDFRITGECPITINLQEKVRFLRVQIPGSHFLHFREFEAYGTLCG